MPSKSTPFTPSSILFRPRNQVHPCIQAVPVCRFPVSSVRRPGRNRPSVIGTGRAQSSRGSSPMTDGGPLPWKLVEAPGTAPGSEWFIPTAIYRHSRQAGAANIGGNGRRRKSRRTVLFKESEGGGTPAVRAGSLHHGTFYRGSGGGRAMLMRPRPDAAAGAGQTVVRRRLQMQTATGARRGRNTAQDGKSRDQTMRVAPRGENLAGSSAGPHAGRRAVLSDKARASAFLRDACVLPAARP
jgi:hypothetical protein